MVVPSLNPPSTNHFMVSSLSKTYVDSILVLLPSIDTNFVSVYDFGPDRLGLPSPSQNTPVDAITLPCSIAVNSSYTQCTWPSGLTMAYFETPPTVKSHVCFSMVQGLGAIHFASNAGSVNAFHTFSIGALNSRDK